MKQWWVLGLVLLTGGCETRCWYPWNGVPGECSHPSCGSGERVTDNDDPSTAIPRSSGSGLELFGWNETDGPESALDHWSAEVLPGDTIIGHVVAAQRFGELDARLVTADGFPVEGSQTDSSWPDGTGSAWSVWTNQGTATQEVVLRVEPWEWGGDTCQQYDFSLVTCTEEPTEGEAPPPPLRSGPNTAALTAASTSDEWLIAVEAGDQVDISVRFIHQLGDIDVFLYEDEREVAGSADTNDEEQIRYNATEDRVLRVEVFRFGSDATPAGYCQPYTIEATFN